MLILTHCLFIYSFGCPPIATWWEVWVRRPGGWGQGVKRHRGGALHDFAEGGGGEAAGGRRRPLLCAFVCFPLLLFVQYFFHPKLEECPACSRFAFILKKKRIFLPHFEIGIYSRWMQLGICQWKLEMEILFLLIDFDDVSAKWSKAMSRKSLVFDQRWYWSRIMRLTS